MNNDKRIYLSPPHAAGAELKYMLQAFVDNWIAPVGPDINAFEKALSAYTGSPHVAAVSSGTAAIHLALILLGIGKGDEVLVSSFTFAASANPVIYQGATPVFIDSEESTWNLDPVLLEEAICSRIKHGHKPKALIAVHLYGMPFQVQAVMEICDRYQIPVIEDAAEALGSLWNGRKLGTFGRLGILSFNGNKIITTSGGGALLGAEEQLISHARHLATQARDPAPHYEHSKIGYNYRLSNLLAAFGRGQLEYLDSFVRRRREIFSYYKERLGAIQGISFLEEPTEEYFCNRWLTTILINPKKTGGVDWQALHQAFGEENIEVRPLWKPLHSQPAFKDCPRVVNGTAERLFAQGLCLPSGSGLTETQQEQICTVIENTLERKANRHLPLEAEARSARSETETRPG